MAVNAVQTAGDAPYRQAVAEIKRRIKAARSSFTMGMTILPPARRDAMFALYAFCRAVDDIADDGATEAERRIGLEEWRSRIRHLFAGAASEDVTQVLLPAISAFDLKEADFQAIIDGMAMDAGSPIVAPDWDTLDLYCDRVASAVGRVSVRLFGDGSEQAMKVAYHLGRAFQLTNILRDINEDAQRGRLYLPAELLAKHGIHERDPLVVLHHPALAPLARELAGIAQLHFDNADAAMRKCPATAMRPARMMEGYYKGIFEALVAADWQHPEQRVSLSKWRKALIVLQQLTKRS